MDLTVENFKQEIQDAVKVYDKHIVCLDKCTQDCEASLVSLMEKGINAYNSRGAGQRHGIALDKQITIILSQTDSERPLCGIYFNLFTPYRKKEEKRKASVK